jgi:iron complex transport system substrate-binding protein
VLQLRARHAALITITACLTEEPTEVLCALGQQHRIVGISGYTVRPPQARQEKPRVSAFTSAKVDKILALQPGLAIGFSDMRADIAEALVRAGVEVWISNHRSVSGILGYVHRLGALVGCAAEAGALAAQPLSRVDAVRTAAAALPRRPRVYFEEWDVPAISAIRWVSELLAVAGGDDIFPHRAAASLGKDRIVADGAEVINAASDIIIGGWCGKKSRPEQVSARPGWGGDPGGTGRRAA